MAQKTKKSVRVPQKEKDYGTIQAKERPYQKERYITHAKSSTRILYLLALLVLVVFNFLIFLLLVPLAIFMDSLQRHLTVGLIGLVFGLIFNFLVMDLEHLEPRHHLAAALLIPLVAMVNLLIMTFLVNSLRDIWELPQAGGALTESAVYAAFFIGPYLLTLLRGQARAP